MKKIFKTLAICMLCVGISFGSAMLVGCKKDKNASKQLNSMSQIYSFAALTTGMYLTDNEPSSASLQNAQQTPNAFAQDVKEQVQKYIGILDSVVGGNVPVTTQKAELTQAETDAGYTTKMVVSANGIGQQKTYTILFAETKTNSQDADKKVYDPDDYELSTKLDGKIVIGEKEIAIHGIKTVEPADQETELEFWAVDEENDKKVSFEIENKPYEQEFEYAIFNGAAAVVPAETFSFELEVKNNKIEIELETMVNGKEMGFEIEQITKKDGTRYLEISYIQPGKAEVEDILVTISNDGVYTYKHNGIVL